MRVMEMDSGNVDDSSSSSPSVVPFGSTCYSAGIKFNKAGIRKILTE